MTFWDILLIVISCLLIVIIMLQDSKEDAANAFTGEKSALFANKKERGIEVWVSRITTVLAVAFLALAFVVCFFVQHSVK